jgi:hypothetical protein
MNTRGVATVFCLAIGLGAGYATAQEPTPVAHLTHLQGNVLVSKDDAMVAAANNEPLALGTRVLTTKAASAVVEYGDGCIIQLKENERFTVDKGSCSALAAGVVALGPAPGAIGGGVAAGGAIGGGLGPEVLIPIAIGGVGLYELYKPVSSVSPN